MAFIPISIPRSYLVSFSRFLVVGSLGFAINALLLTLLHRNGVPFYAAQIIGAETALLSNFFFHDHWTFKSPEVAKLTRPQRLLLYHASSLLGSLVNSAITITAHSLWNFPPVIALATGSVVALFINYTFSAFVTWKKLHQKPE